MMQKSGISPMLGAVLLMVLSLVASCTTDGCLNNQNSLPLAGFYSSSTGLAIALDSVDIGGVGAPHDSLLHTTGSTVSEVYLPFRSAAKETSFYLHYTEQALDNPIFNDTITFRYTSEPYFASEECGAMYCFRITDVQYTTHIIDSVGVADSVITNVDIQRIRIYMRTELPDENPEPNEPAE